MHFCIVLCLPAGNEGAQQPEVEVSPPTVYEEGYTPVWRADATPQPRAEIVSREADLSARPPSAAWGATPAYTTSSTALPVGMSAATGQASAVTEPVQVGSHSFSQCYFCDALFLDQVCFITYGD